MLGIAKVTESMQLCAYYLTINYYMVKLTNYKKAIDRPLSVRDGNNSYIILLQVAIFYCTLLSHDADNPQCNCLLCMLNHVPEEGEYIYKPLLILLVLYWIAVIFAAVF